MPPIHATHTDEESSVVYDATIPAGQVDLQAQLRRPLATDGWVIIGHSRHHRHSPILDSPFGHAGLGTMHVHLHPPPQSPPSLESETALQLTQQIVVATRWLRAELNTLHTPIGLFGTYQDAEIALSAAAFLGNEVGAVVSYQGWPVKAMNHLPDIKAPTLLLVNEGNDALLAANVQASWWLNCTQQLTLVPGRPRLLSERCPSHTINLLAGNWYRQHLFTHKPLKAFPCQLFAAAKNHEWSGQALYQ